MSNSDVNSAFTHYSIDARSIIFALRRVSKGKPFSPIALIDSVLGLDDRGTYLLA